MGIRDGRGHGTVPLFFSQRGYLLSACLAGDVRDQHDGAAMNMNRFRFLALFLLVMATVSIGTTTTSAQSLATALEIRTAFVGRTVVIGGAGEATYGKDGSYRFVAGGQTWIGQYTIGDGEICVTFDRTPGCVVTQSRCDRITKQGNSYTLTTTRVGTSTVQFR
jgi:hypothetical protein